MESILDLIGNTPLVGVHALSPNPAVRIYAKLEGQNPGGSSKDRIALKMVELAEKDGVLKPGDTILEPSSGNTGIGLALVAQLRGYGLRVVMPENVSRRTAPAARDLRRRDHAEPGGGGQQRRDPAGAGDRRRRSPATSFLYQYGNPANPLAHYEGTGPEIWRDCPEVDVFVAGLGTSGTLMGVGRYLKEQKPEVRVVAVEPPAGELVQGLRNLDDGFVPPIFTPDVLDRKLIVRPRESIEWTRRLLDECGVFAGHLVGCGGRRRGEGRGDDGLGHDRHAAARRRMEVPLVRRVDRRPRRRRGTGPAHQLLVTDATATSRRRAARVVAILRDGGLVAFPTETVYGLGADATNRDALRRLYAVKRRPAEHPVIVHLARAEQLDDWADRDLAGRAHARRRVLARPAHARGAARAAGSRTRSTGGLDTVGLRVPGHPLALELLAAFGGGLAAPSANRFGRVSPTTADAVRAELGDAVSTRPRRRRVHGRGRVDDRRLHRPSRACCASGASPASSSARSSARELPIGGATRAPGTLASHYAPRARVEVVAAGDLVGARRRARRPRASRSGCSLGARYDSTCHRGP